MNVLRRAASQHLRALGARGYASGSGNPERKVAILGAAGGIGQPLSLLMKVRVAGAILSQAAVQAALLLSSRVASVQPLDSVRTSVMSSPAYT